MLTSPLTFIHEGQKRRDDSKPPTAFKAGSHSEVILILGEPTPGDLSAILRWGAIPPRRSRQHRLLIFASDIRGLPQSPLKSHYLDIHIFSNCLGEGSGPDLQCPNQAPGQAMHLVGVLERASRLAAAWRADVEQFTCEGKLTQGDPPFPSGRGSAHSPYLSGGTHAIDSLKTNHPTCITPAALNDVNYLKLHSSQNHPHGRSISTSKPTANRSASNGLLPNLNLPTVPRPSCQNPTNLGIHSQSLNQHFPLETCGGTFDTILNFLPANLAEKSLLKQVILLSTLCGQYLARPKFEIHPLGSSRAFGSPTSRASTSTSPFSSGASHSQNLKERVNSLFSRTPTTESKVGEARRSTTASPGPSSTPGSASPARSSTPSETSKPTIVSDTPQRRWSMLSWLSTSSTSQTSDPKPGANMKVDTCTDFNMDVSRGQSIELRHRLSSLFGRTPKGSELASRGIAGGEESTRKRKRTKKRQTPHKRAYLMHVLPTTWLPTSLPADSSHALDSLRTENQIRDEPESLEKRRKSLPLPSPLSGSLHESFTHARMQTSLIRRATLQQTRIHNLERRYSMPTARVERAASRTILNPISRGGSLTRNPLQVQREKLPLVDHLENFLGDYFGQGEILPFVFDVGVLGREVAVGNMGKRGSKKRMLVGEAVLSGLLDEFAMNRRCWVGEEDLKSLAGHIRGGGDEETEGPILEEETVKSPLLEPKHPPPAMISPSSSEGSEGAGPACTPSPQRSRSRAISDFGSAMLPSQRSTNPSPGAALNALKSPEPAHVYPPSRPSAPTRHTPPIPVVNASNLYASRRRAKV